LVSISRSKKSRVATTAETCCIGLDIAGILRSTKAEVSADYVTRFVPVTPLQYRSTLADLLTVVLPKACEGSEQARFRLASLVELIQELHVISSVAVLLH
tara:strand:+ start:2442 stop:2741 length:300 start_codon:yes stop_codon:yes gene_type:complete